MKLTKEVKEYIECCVRQHIPKLSEEHRFTTIATAAKSTATDLSKEVSELIRKTTDEFVKKYPEARGIQFEFEYGCRMSPNLCSADIKTRRDELINMKSVVASVVISKIQVIASTCADISELDRAISEIVSDEFGLLCPSSCAGHTTTP